MKPGKEPHAARESRLGQAWSTVDSIDLTYNFKF